MEKVHTDKYEFVKQEDGYFSSGHIYAPGWLSARLSAVGHEGKLGFGRDANTRIMFVGYVRFYLSDGTLDKFVQPLFLTERGLYTWGSDVIQINERFVDIWSGKGNG